MTSKQLLPVYRYCYPQEKRETEKYKNLCEEKEAEGREQSEFQKPEAGIDVGKLDSRFSAGFSTGLRLGCELGSYEFARKQTLSIQRIVLDRIKMKSEKRRKEQEHFQGIL